MRLQVQVTAVRLKGKNVEFDLVIQNPNPTPLTVSAIVGDVFVTNTVAGKPQTVKIGHVDKYGTNVIKPTAANKFILDIQMKLVNEFIWLSEVAQGKVSGMMFGFAGTVTINGKPYPIKEAYKL
jgi:LEA14-like dessication related protein